MRQPHECGVRKDRVLYRVCIAAVQGHWWNTSSEPARRERMSHPSVFKIEIKTLKQYSKTQNFGPKFNNPDMNGLLR